MLVSPLRSGRRPADDAMAAAAVTGMARCLEMRRRSNHHGRSVACCALGPASPYPDDHGWFISSHASSRWNTVVSAVGSTVAQAQIMILVKSSALSSVPLSAAGFAQSLLHVGSAVNARPVQRFC